MLQNILYMIDNNINNDTLENSNNKINLFIYDVLQISSKLVLDSNFILAIYKLSIQYIFKQIPKYDDILDDMKDFITKISELVFNISSNYLNMVLKIDKNQDVEVKDFKDLCIELRSYLMNNNYISINEKTIEKYFDSIILPYYINLYQTVINHQIKMLNNYFKFIYNQYIDIKIIILLLCKILPPTSQNDEIYQIIISS